MQPEDDQLPQFSRKRASRRLGFRVRVRVRAFRVSGL